MNMKDKPSTDENEKEHHNKGNGDITKTPIRTSQVQTVKTKLPLSRNKVQAPSTTKPASDQKAK